jgi:hypothetical protein
MTTLFDVPACQATLAGGIDSFESITGRHKNLQIWALKMSLDTITHGTTQIS